MGNPYRYLIKQLIALAVGLCLAFGVSRVDASLFRRPVGRLFGARSLSRCSARRSCFRPPINSARRWHVFGKLTLQPSEFLKVALVLLLAYQIDRKRDRLDDFVQGILPTAFFLAIATALVLAEPDLGTAASLVLVAATLLLLAGAPLRYFALGAAACLPVLGDPRGIGELPAPANPLVPPSGGRSAREGIPGGAVAHRRRDGRLDRQRARAVASEALLSSVSAHRFHLRDRRRGARLPRRDRGTRLSSASSPGGACARRGARPSPISRIWPGERRR